MAQEVPEFITHYTVEEGGEWESVKDTVRTYILPQDNKRSNADMSYILNRELMCNIHSIKTSKNRRWDCINGWTN